MVVKNSLEKKLGVFGKDLIVRRDGSLNAQDYYCSGCYSLGREVEAVGFSDGDSGEGALPYCNDCLKYLRMKVDVDFDKFDEFDF